MVLRRKVFNLFLMLICLFAVLGLASCGGNNNQSNNNNNNNNQQVQPSPEKPKSAVESLNKTELAIYNKILSVINDYKDPSSVKVQSLYEYWESAIEVRIQAKNDFGANVTSKYLYFFKDVTVTNQDMAKYSKASINAYGEVVEPSKISAYGKTGDFVSVSYVEKLYEQQNSLVYGVGNTNVYALAFRLFHFQNKNGDQLSIEVSVAKLNAALTEYKESQGW